MRQGHPAVRTAAPFAPALALRTGVKEGNDLHAPQRLRVRLVGPGKKGSVRQAEYLSELLESVPEHPRSPTHAYNLLRPQAADCRRAGVLPLPRGLGALDATLL